MRLRVLAAAAALLAAAPALARAPQAPDRGPDQGDAPPGWPQPEPICSAELGAYCPDPGLKLGLCQRERLDMSPDCRAIQEGGWAQPVGRDPPEQPQD